LKPILGSPAPFTESQFEQEVYRRTGLSAIDRTDPEDIFIVGYPKSGNTWMQNLVAGVIYGIDARLAPDSLIQDLVPDVHFSAVVSASRQTHVFQDPSSASA